MRSAERSKNYLPKTAKSVVVDGKDSSLRIETVFWEGLQQIAEREGTTTGTLLKMIEHRCQPGSNLHSCIRCFVLAYFKSMGKPLLRAGHQAQYQSHRQKAAASLLSV